jgi:anti-sigma regulatory factor (Ser/Thr protein kinase)
MRAWELPVGLGSAGEARREIRWLLSGGMWDDVVDDVALTVSELVTNAVLHAASAVTMTVLAGDDVLRVEVADSNPRSSRLDARLPVDAAGATGRGLGIVAALARRWGVDDEPGGTTVWFELDRAPADPTPAPPVIVNRAAASAPAGDRRVSLLDIPTDTFVADQRHQEDLYREFQLLRAGPSPVPATLATLTTAVVDRYARAHELGRTEGARAATEGRDRFDFAVWMPPEAAPDGRRWLELLTEADERCEAGELVTLPASPAVRALRAWYVEEAGRQLGGEPPRPCPLPAGPDVIAPPTP